MLRVREVIPHIYQLAVLGSSAFLLVEDGVTVIDTGQRGSGRLILEYLGYLGRSPQDIRYIIATHYHLDHIGGIAHLQKTSSGQVAVHEAEAPFLQWERPLPNPFQNPLLAFLMTPLFALSRPQPIAVALRLKDGDRLRLLGEMQVIHSPGHTPGSICLYFPQEGLLIAGDALEYRRGRLGLPSRLFTEDMVQAKESIRRLAQLDFEVLCFSHFLPLQKGAAQALRTFAETLD